MSLHYLNYDVPRRLSDATHALADRYLNTDEIRNTLIDANFSVPESAATLNQLFAQNIRLIVENAPLRILPEERLAGAATYLEGPAHRCPGHRFPGISHTTINFAKAVTVGLKGLEQEIFVSLGQPDRTDEERDFLQSLLSVISSMRIWRDRLIAALPGSGPYADTLVALLKNVPENPPKTFYEALQSFWFHFEFQRLCGNWSGLGRIDQLWTPYLLNDLKAKRITLDDARELLAHFWIKGAEWKGVQRGSGDAQHYQNVILAGVDDNGIRDIDTTVAELILDVVEELHIADYPIAVRVNSRTTDDMYRRIARVQRHGGGIVSIYNEDIVLKALQNFGYGGHAYAFTNDGCWETIIGGKSAFGYGPFDSLQLFQDALFGTSPEEREDASKWPQFTSVEQLMDAWSQKLQAHVDAVNARMTGYMNDPNNPALALSLLVDDCIGKARPYTRRGAKFTIFATHAGGLPDVANSLLAIDHFVFKTHTLTLDELRRHMLDDWKDADELRRSIASTIAYYGNDDATADAMAKRVFDRYVKIASCKHDVAGVLRPVGISTFGRELEYAPKRLATAFGTHKGVLLAPNFSATPGTEKHGPTAVINSFCKNDFESLSNGTPLDIKIHPSAIEGENGLQALVALLKTFVANGGSYLQVDVADAKILRDAQAHPENYANLSVRISGWSARFTTLNRDWQEMVIARTEHH